MEQKLQDQHQNHYHLLGVPQQEHPETRGDVLYYQATSPAPLLSGPPPLTPSGGELSDSPIPPRGEVRMQIHQDIITVAKAPPTISRVHNGMFISHFEEDRLWIKA
ncbi:hypothetical protein Tco_1287861 [Tanacetum coccineum]